MTAPTKTAAPVGSGRRSARHGTPSTYASGCRCYRCRVAARSYHRAARRKRRALLDAGAVQVEHGQRSTYTDWGCRCDDCRAANRVAMAAYRQRLRAQLDSGEAEARVDHGTLEAYRCWACRCARCWAAWHVASCRACATIEEALQHRAWSLTEPVPVCLCDVAELGAWGCCQRCGMPVAASMAQPVRHQAYAKWPRLIHQVVTTDNTRTDEATDSWEVVCRVCGCSEDRPCPGGCVWVPPPDLDGGDLCSACADGAGADRSGLCEATS